MARWRRADIPDVQSHIFIRNHNHSISIVASLIPGNGIFMVMGLFCSSWIVVSKKGEINTNKQVGEPAPADHESADVHLEHQFITKNMRCISLKSHCEGLLMNCCSLMGKILTPYTQPIITPMSIGWLECDGSRAMYLGPDKPKLTPRITTTFQEPTPD